ncbi:MULTISPECIES: helix-turn-helix domain-containing protein [Saccharothrix]|uniref:helix-turn-helix domain-containing protein n=1 Tax=Saccharothrix TaxID=2071 RepID=UPI00116105FB|nr:helix-turn-helix domain-containing protein [Saccharothrix sp. CB00851]
MRVWIPNAGALLLADNGAVSDTQMSDFLWGDHPPATVDAQIYTYVSRLRKRCAGRSVSPAARAARNCGSPNARST